MSEPNTPVILPGFRKAFEGDGFKSDARVFLTVTDAAFDRIVGRLETGPGILGPSRIREAVAIAGVTDDRHVQLLLRILPIFARWGRTIAQGKTEAVVATMRVALEHDFTDLERETLAMRLSRLLDGSFPGLALADKAEIVARATGRQLRGVQLITDVRPVFDERRETVLAVVPMTTLRLTTDTEDENVPATICEVQLSELDLNELGRKVAEAQQKCAVTKKLLGEKDISIAECAMVVTDGDGT